MKHLDLVGTTTVITGAANGMGADIARHLAASRGVHLALIDHDAAALARVVEALSGATVTTHVIDLHDDDAVFAGVAGITAAHPRTNALITCAGSSMLGTLDQLTMEEMRWLTDVSPGARSRSRKRCCPLCARRLPPTSPTSRASTRWPLPPGEFPTR